MHVGQVLSDSTRAVDLSLRVNSVKLGAIDSEDKISDIAFASIQGRALFARPSDQRERF